MYMNSVLEKRFGFVLTEIGRLYVRRFDQLARDRLTLSSAQCRALAVLAAHQEDGPISQAELADRLNLSPMAVATMCDRLSAAGMVRRESSPDDRRANVLLLEPCALDAVAAAMAIGDELEQLCLDDFTTEERLQFAALLGRVLKRLGTA